jgi:hypothetical protein
MVNKVNNIAAKAGTNALTMPLNNSAIAFPCAILLLPIISTIIFLPDGPSMPPKIPKATESTPIKIIGEMSKLTVNAIKTNIEAAENLVINNTTFLEYLSASLPPIGAAKGLTKIGKDDISPTMKEESVSSKTYQFTRINLRKKVEKAKLPENKSIEKYIFVLFKIFTLT